MFAGIKTQTHTYTHAHTIDIIAELNYGGHGGNINYFMCAVLISRLVDSHL